MPAKPDPIPRFRTITLRALSANADGFLVELEAREREATCIATLKVGYNRVHGY